MSDLESPIRIWRMPLSSADRRKIDAAARRDVAFGVHSASMRGLAAAGEESLWAEVEDLTRRTMDARARLDQNRIEQEQATTDATGHQTELDALAGAPLPPPAEHESGVSDAVRRRRLSRAPISGLSAARERLAALTVEAAGLQSRLRDEVDITAQRARVILAHTRVQLEHFRDALETSRTVDLSSPDIDVEHFIAPLERIVQSIK
jgi:hypothetical protein